MEKKDLGKTSTGIPVQFAAPLCYALGFITGIVFYLIEKENKFVRFHAMQSIIAFGSLAIVGIVVPVVIPVFGTVLSALIGLLNLVLWIVLMIKAYQGEQFKLPIAGDIAEKKA